MSRSDFDVLLDAKALAEVRNEFVVRRGVYFLWEGDEIVYVGQSTNIHQRIAAHFVDKWREWKIDGYSFVEVHPSINLDAIEAAYILKFTPRYNRSR